MSNPVDRALVNVSFSPLERLAAPSGVRPARPFAEVLRAPQPSAERPLIPERLREMLRDISDGERYVDGVIAQAAHGRDFSPAELIAVQARVYRYTQELELLSKLVDKATSGVRQTLQTQV